MVSKGKQPTKRAAQPTRLPVATVSLSDAAQVLGIGTSTAYRLAEAGEFPVEVKKIGGVRRVLIVDLERYIGRSLAGATG